MIGGPALTLRAGDGRWVIKVLDRAKIQRCEPRRPLDGYADLARLRARYPQRVERHRAHRDASRMNWAKRSRRGEAQLLRCFRHEHASGPCAAVPLGGNPHPGMWIIAAHVWRGSSAAPACSMPTSGVQRIAFAGTIAPCSHLGKRDVMTSPLAAKGLQTTSGPETVVIDFSAFAHARRPLLP